MTTSTHFIGANDPFSAHTFTIENFLTQSGTGFYIPLYQRPYRWTTANAIRLLADIVEGITRHRETNRSSTFLGTLITVSDKDDLSPAAVIRPPKVLQVIDGQQRIATLLGMFGELRRAIGAAILRLHEDEKEQISPVANKIVRKLDASLSFRPSDAADDTLPRMIRGGRDQWDIPTHKYTSEIGRYLATFNAERHREPTNDRSFDGVLSTLHASFDSDKPLSGQVVSPNADQWNALFSQPQPPHISTSHRTSRLLKLLTVASFTMKHIHLISVRAKDEASATAIFESLNTTGELLTAFETFVPLVVSETRGQTHYSGSLEESEIKRFQSLLRRQHSAEAAKRTKKTLVAFALSETGYKLGEQLHEQRSYLRQYRKLPPEHKLTFIKGLGQAASCLKALLYSNVPLAASSAHTRVALKMLIDARHTIPQGLLIRAYEEYNEDQPTWLHQLVRIVADFWLLWRLSRSTTDNIDRYHRGIMEGVRYQDKILGPYCRRPKERNGFSPRPPKPEDVAADLRWILKKKGGINSRDAWVSKASELAHWSQGNKALLRYALLGAYHDTVVDPFPRPIRPGAIGVMPTLTMEWYQEKLTIEHIAPQRKEDDDNSYADSIYKGARVHRLGNLTLLPKEENRVLSNKLWLEKLAYFKLYDERDATRRREMVNNFQLRPTTARLLSSRFVPFCGDIAALDDDQWTETHIENRGITLAGLIWDRFAPSLELH